MYVSPDMIGILIAMVTLGITLGGITIGMTRRLETRMNARFEKVDERFEKVDERFEKFERSMDERFEKAETSVAERFESVDEQLRTISADVVDLKVAVARLEGPQPTLLRAR